MKRLDVVLVERGLAPTRSKAQQMIDAHEVEMKVDDVWLTVTTASRVIRDVAELRIAADSEVLKYVSRGGLKLQSALQELNLDVTGMRCFDVGLSTGGFADVLLQKGAQHVIGIDVGHDQLHARLKNDGRITSFEGVNVRELAGRADIRAALKDVRLVVADLSFISLTLVLPALAEIWPYKASLLALVKPQFEVGAENLNGQGVVTDTALFEDVKKRILLSLEKYGFSTDRYFPASVRGQDGNQEFFVSARRS